MKKYCIMLLASTILLSSCSTGAGTGAYAGGSLGSVLGSAIGGIIGGPRGSDIGTVIGMASGAAAGAAIGDAAEKKQCEAVMGEADDQGSRPSRRSRLSPRDREALARRNQRIQRQKTQQRYNSSYNADDYTDDMYVSGSQRSTTQSNKLTDTPLQDPEQTPLDSEQTPLDSEQTPLDSEQTPLNSEQTPLDSEQTNESVPETELNTDIVVDTENSGDDRIDFQPSEPTDPTNEQQ